MERVTWVVFFAYIGQRRVRGDGSVITGQPLRLLGAKPRMPANTGPQWVDYPAFALSLPPATSLVGAAEVGHPGTSAIGGSRNNKGGGKKGQLQVPYVPHPNPLFDILVEPEYVPDPFPVPFAFPVEVEPEEISHNKTENHQQQQQLQVQQQFTQPHEGTYSSSPRYRRHQYLERAQPLWQCPRDFYHEGSQCVRIDQVPLELGCQEGWKFDHNMCRGVESVPHDNVCDEGFVPWDDKPECVREIVAPKEMRCQPGFTPSTEGCKRDVESPPVADCHDASLVKGSCRRPTAAVPATRCPADFVANADPMACYREYRTDGVIVCPDASYVLLHDGTCEKRTSKLAEPGCAVGFEIQNGRCNRQLSEMPTTVCDQGILQSDGLCGIAELGPPPELLCDVGKSFNPQHQKCESHVEYAAQAICPRGYQEDQHGSCVSVQKYKEKKKGIATVQPTWSCPSGLELTKGSKCAGIEMTKPSLTCSYPFQLKDNQCYKKSVVSPVTSCPVGSHLHERACVHVETTEIQYTCPSGYTLKSDHTCHHVVTAAASTKCPQGYDLLVGGQQCQRMERIDATLECPPTMVLTKGFDKVYTCKGEEVFEPTYTCTVAGMELHKGHDGAICKGVNVEPISLVCPSTFQHEEGRCIKYDVAPMRPVCPADYTLSFDICLKQVEQHPLILCPQGYQHEAHSRSCVRKRTTEPTPECPPDMTYDRLVGECYAVRVQYDFEELPVAAGPREGLEQIVAPIPPTSPPREAELPLEGPVPPATTTTTTPIPYVPILAAQPQVPAPQLTIVQQPVVVPQPAIILPQQAPVPPPPAIRVPYAVPQPVPTPVKPKHQHIVHDYHHEIVVPKGKHHHK